MLTELTVFALHYVPNCQKSIFHGYLKGVVAKSCSMHREHETGTCSPSPVLFLVKKAPTGKLQCLYILG